MFLYWNNVKCALVVNTHTHSSDTENLIMNKFIIEEWEYKKKPQDI